MLTTAENAQALWQNNSDGSKGSARGRAEQSAVSAEELAGRRYQRVRWAPPNVGIVLDLVVRSSDSGAPLTDRLPPVRAGRLPGHSQRQ